MDATTILIVCLIAGVTLIIGVSWSSRGDESVAWIIAAALMIAAWSNYINERNYERCMEKSTERTRQDC